MMQAKIGATGSESSPGHQGSWTSASLGECADILDGRRVPINSAEREKRTGGKHASELFPYYGATGQVGFIDGYLFNEEIVLLGEDGAPFLERDKAKAYMVSGKTWVNNHAHVLRARSQTLTNSFLLHYLNHFDYHGYVTGTTRLKLTQAEMRKIPVPLPPLPEQHRIVAEIEKQFSRLDAAVAALKRAQINLRRYRASVLKAACEGRLVPQDPNDEPASELLKRNVAEHSHKKERQEGRPGELLDEHREQSGHGLPLLPTKWCWTNLGQLKQFSLYGPRFSSDGYSDTGQFVLRTSDISEYGRVDIVKAPRLCLEPDVFAKYKVERGDLLVTRTGSLGTLAVFNDEVDAIAGAYLIQYRLSAPITTSWYVFYALRSPSGLQQLLRKGAGVGRPNLNAPNLEMIPIPLPPLAEQRRIVAEVERRLSVVDELEAAVGANLKRAERLRQAILKRAFEGRLVPQDPNDEPASVLLERIRVQRESSHGEAKLVRPGLRSASPAARPR